MDIHLQTKSMKTANQRERSSRHSGGYKASLIAALFVALSILAVCFISPSIRSSEWESAALLDQTTDQISGSPTDQNSSQDSTLSQVFSPQRDDASKGDSVKVIAARVTLRLALAALLAAMLAFRPHKQLPIMHRNPYVAQTQILLAVVAAALMMTVADSAARAFGIFAAASLVRFRTNISDPKEITVLLVSLGIGLATGVGKYELAIIFSLFVLLLLWVLERFEPGQIHRVLDLKLKTRNVDATQEAMKKILEGYGIDAEVRELDHQDDFHPIGKIVYRVDINPKLSTDRLSEEIFSTDPENIDSVEWHQKKSLSYIYR
jgi:uncharacterized membrane protein YhiD involved in acid resistance